MPPEFHSHSRADVAVYVVTAHGRQSLNSYKDECVLDILNRHNVPWSGVSIYAVLRSGGPPQLYSCLDRSLADMKEEVSEILVYFNRNVNPFLFSFNQFKTVESGTPSGSMTEYFYQLLDNSHSSAEVVLKKLSPEECKSIISDHVSRTVRAFLPPGSDLVVGVSG